jgi:hypothetical protein
VFEYDEGWDFVGFQPFFILKLLGGKVARYQRNVLPHDLATLPLCNLATKILQCENG